MYNAPLVIKLYLVNLMQKPILVVVANIGVEEGSMSTQDNDNTFQYNLHDGGTHCRVDQRRGCTVFCHVLLHTTRAYGADVNSIIIDGNYFSQLCYWMQRLQHLPSYVLKDVVVC